MNTLVTLPMPLQRRLRRWAAAGLQTAIVAFLVLALVHSADMPPPDVFKRQLSEKTSGLVFNFATWEWDALLIKLGLGLAAPQDTLTEAQRHRLVIDYFAGMRRARELRAEITALYSQLEGEQALARAAAPEQELAGLRDWLSARQSMVEGILEEQVSAELEAEGLGRWGYVLPPVKIRFTELPLLLVISSRAAITREADVHLRAGLAITEREQLEANVDQAFAAMTSLVTPIGGLSAYPAMILEHEGLVWLTDTFAHEWTHHFLIFRPLGYNYDRSGEMTTINETTASIVGREVGRRVILSYYPEMVPQLPPLPSPPDRPPMSAGEMVWPEEPPPDQFDYNREMRKTRLRVDELLAEGQIEQAEAYMEQRRLFFVAQGYNIRKLNQAYFAFYGSYATNPSTGNPIGGQLEWLRGQSASLRNYLFTVAPIGQYEDLLALLQP